MHRKHDIRQLITECQRGDRSAQKQLFEHYVSTMLSTCFRMLNSKQEAEDVVQDGFVQAFQHLDGFRHESKFGHWLKRIMLNKCLDRLKQRKLKIVDATDAEWEKGEDDGGEEPEYTIADVQAAMQNLPDGLRIVFSLYYLEGYDHEEIASILGISTSGSKSQLSKARSRVRKEILLKKHKNLDHYKSKQL